MLACNEDMYESSEEFEVRPDLTTDCGVSCLERLAKSPYAFNEKNGIATFSQLFSSDPFHTYM